jgi:hypothetical protein
LHVTPLLDQLSERGIDVAGEANKGFMVDHNPADALILAQDGLQRLESPLGHGLLLYFVSRALLSLRHFWTDSAGPPLPLSVLR